MDLSNLYKMLVLNNLLYYFLGEVESVKGHASLDKNYDVTEVEDTAQAFIRFKNGATAVFYATNCNTLNSDIELELYFEKGSLHYAKRVSGEFSPTSYFMFSNIENWQLASK